MQRVGGQKGSHPFKTLEVYVIGMCTQEMGQGRTGGDAVGAGDQEQVCFGNVGCPSVGGPWPLFQGGMPPPPLS